MNIDRPVEIENLHTRQRHRQAKKSWLTALAMCAITSLLLACHTEPSITTTEWVREVKPQMREGDIVFRKGNSTASRAVTLSGGQEEIYSHVGIVIYNTYTDRLEICHAVPGESSDKVDVVKTDSIEEFFKPTKAYAGMIVRVQCDDTTARHAARYAFRQYLNKKNFDHDYDMHDTSALYCTELVVRAYETIGIDLVEDRIRHLHVPKYTGDFIFPSAINNSKYITIISKY